MSASPPKSSAPLGPNDGDGVGLGRARAFLDQKIPVCAGMLAEAQKLARCGQTGPILGPFVQRTVELLDELDELLVAMDPVQDRAIFVTIASLHRNLDSIRAVVSPPPTDRKPGSATAVGGR